MPGQIFTQSNSKITLNFRDTKFIMLGYETAAYTGTRRNEVTYDPNRKTDGLTTKQGGIEGDTLVVTTSIEDAGLINTMNEVFETAESGNIIITHKDDNDRLFIMQARVMQQITQDALDDSMRSKLTFNFIGKLTKNTF